MAVAIPSLSMLRAFSNSLSSSNNQDDDECFVVSPSPIPGSYPEYLISVNSVYSSGSSSSSASSSSTSSPIRSPDLFSPLLATATATALSLNDSSCCDESIATNTILSPESLPTELRIRIFSFLEVPKLLKASMVCKRWNDLAYDGNLWERIDMGVYYKHIGAAQLQRLAKRSAGFLKYANFRGCLQLTSAVMRVFAVNCYNIELLCLAGCRSASAAALAYFLANSPSLKALDVSGLPTINNTILEIISSHCINLTNVNASYCRSITVVGISSLVRGCRKLMDLQLAHCTGLDDEALLVIASMLQLKRLNVAHCPLVTDRGLVHLSKSPSKSIMQALKMSNCPQVSDAGLIPLITEAKELGILEVASCRHLTDNVVNTLAMNCPSVHHLDLEECIRITDAALHSIALHLGPSMEVLVLSYCDAITDDGAMALLRGCQNLQKLEIDNCSRITDNLLRSIGAGLAGGQLKELELWDCRGVSQSAIYQLVKAVSSSSNNNSSSLSSSVSSGSSGMDIVRGREDHQHHHERQQQLLTVKSFYTQSQEHRSPSSGTTSGAYNVGRTTRRRPSCTVF